MLLSRMITNKSEAKAEKRSKVEVRFSRSRVLTHSHVLTFSRSYVLTFSRSYVLTFLRLIDED